MRKLPSSMPCKVCGIRFYNSIDDSKNCCSMTCKLKYKPSLEDLKKTKKNEPINTQQSKSGLSKKQRRKLKRKNKKLTHQPKSRGFYDTQEWLEIRYNAIKLYGRTCMLCGQTKGIIHVDHIKPRSKFPALQLDINNLQILCRDCNIGKSNKDDTDWRPKVL